MDDLLLQLVKDNNEINSLYEQKVDELVREKYSLSQELAIHRKYAKGLNEDEFNEYNAYVEQCKNKAKLELGIE